MQGMHLHFYYSLINPASNRTATGLASERIKSTDLHSLWYKLVSNLSRTELLNLEALDCKYIDIEPTRR